MLGLVQKTIKTGTEFVCSLVILSTQSMAQLTIWARDSETPFTLAWCHLWHTALRPGTSAPPLACQGEGLQCTTKPKHLARVLSMPKCSERTKSHSHSLGNSAKKTGELILTNLKHYSYNTHRWREMGEHRPSKVQTRAQDWVNLDPNSYHAHPIRILTSVMD